MQRVEFISYKGVSILLVDFSRTTTTEGLEVIEQAKRAIASQPLKTVLTLTDVSDAEYDSSVNEAMRGYVSHNKPYVRAAAVVGASGLRRVALNTFRVLTGRELKVFDDRDSAMEWLAQKA
jgi:hypothetical protein